MSYDESPAALGGGDGVGGVPPFDLARFGAPACVHQVQRAALSRFVAAFVAPPATTREPTSSPMRPRRGGAILDELVNGEGGRFG